jgi:hypothetical protein
VQPIFRTGRILAALVTFAGAWHPAAFLIVFNVGAWVAFAVGLIVGAMIGATRWAMRWRRRAAARSVVEAAAHA